MKFRVLFGKLLYELIGKHLPASTSPIKIGQKSFRRMCGKLILKRCGKKVNIEKGAVFSSKCELGDFSGIGINAYVSGAIIGNHVMMGPNCCIYSFNHRHDRIDVTMDVQGAEEERIVRIDDDVWIGSNVIILPGVKIGKGSIIGAGTVVTKDVPEYSVFCGNPGKVVKNRK